MEELTRRQKTTSMGERNFITQKSREFLARLGRDHDMHMLPNLGIKFPRPLFLKAHVHPRCIARPILQRKTFRVVENRCSLQCVESIFVNLPQFAKSGLKESLDRFFWYFSLHLFGYFGLVSSLFVSVSVCFTALLSMSAPSKRTLERPRRRGSPKYIRLCKSVFLIFGEMGKKLLAANSTDSVFAEFLLHGMFNCKQRSR